MDTRFTVAMEEAPGFLGEKRMTGWWFGTFFHTIWDVILPIDELHHFSRWLKHVKTTNQNIYHFLIFPMISSHCIQKLERSAESIYYTNISYTAMHIYIYTVHMSIYNIQYIYIYTSSYICNAYIYKFVRWQYPEWMLRNGSCQDLRMQRVQAWWCVA